MVCYSSFFLFQSGIVINRTVTMEENRRKEERERRRKKKREKKRKKEFMYKTQYGENNKN